MADLNVAIAGMITRRLYVAAGIGGKGIYVVLVKG